MTERRAGALGLAYEAGLYVVHVGERDRLVLVDGCVLGVGPHADVDAIATIACRTKLGGAADENAVIAEVEAYGYVYTPGTQRVSTGRKRKAAS